MKTSKQTGTKGGGGRKDEQNKDRKSAKEPIKFADYRKEQPRQPTSRTDKPAKSITTLRVKTRQPWIEPAAKSNTLRPIKTTNNSSRAVVRRGIPDFTSYSPQAIVHPSLLEKRGLLKLATQEPRNNGKIGTINDRAVAGSRAEARGGHEITPNQPNDHAITEASSIIEPADKADVNLKQPTPQLGRLDTRLHKVEESLIDHQRTIIKQKLAEKKLKTSNQFTERHLGAGLGNALAEVENGAVRTKPRSILKGAQHAMVASSGTSNVDPPSVGAGENFETETVFNPTIKALRPGSTKKETHSSIKAITWKPELVRVQPLTPPAINDKPDGPNTHVGEISLENEFKDFISAIKGIKSGKSKLLGPLLEALRDLKSDDGSETEVVYSEISGAEKAGEIHGAKIQPSSKTRFGQISLPAEEKVTCAKPAREEIPTGVGTQGQQSYRDVLVAGLPRNSGASEATLVNGDDVCTKGCSNLSVGPVTKLNPKAPVFKSIRLKKLAETRADPLWEQHPFVPAHRPGHQSYDEGNEFRPDTGVGTKVGKYVPPALRGNRNLPPSCKKTREPVWMKVNADGSPMKCTEPNTGGADEPSSNYQETTANDAHMVGNLRQLSAEYANGHLRKDWIIKWVHDAAKPANGLETQYPADYAQKMAEIQPIHKNATDNIALPAGVHEDRMPVELDQLPQPPSHNFGGDLPAFSELPQLPTLVQGHMPYSFNGLSQHPMQCGPSGPYIMQYSNMKAGYPMYPYPLVGPLIPVPGPTFLMDHLSQDPAMQHLPVPLVPINATDPDVTSRRRLSKEENAARIARSLDPAWGDRVLDKFTTRFPMTGKAQSNFPVPPVQDLEGQAAQIQQKLELLILREKELRAAGKWFKPCSRRGMPSVSTSSSENLIKFD